MPAAIIIFMQRICCRERKARSLNSFQKQLKTSNLKSEKKAKINTAYLIAKQLPFSKCEGLLSLQRKNGVIRNNTYAKKESCGEIVSFLSDSFRDDLIHELNSKNYFSLMADGTADFGGTETETVVFRISSFCINNLQVDGKNLHQPASISNAINKYFCNVPTELAPSLPKADRHFTSFMKGKNVFSALLR